MPHSSGGGSHSGGSHSGSGFSSSSSSSGGSSAKHIKHTSFPGARRYVYYENYRPVYVYADYDIRKGPLQVSFSVYLAVLSACSLVSCFLPCAMISHKKWIQVLLIAVR
mgnify:CR=1 FL=1